MSCGGWRVEVSTEVSIFKGEVRCDQDLMSVWRLEDSAVVTDAERNRPVMRREGAAYVLNQREFAGDGGGGVGHPENSINFCSAAHV
jgi:hypothetical protein